MPRVLALLLVLTCVAPVLASTATGHPAGECPLDDAAVAEAGDTRSHAGKAAPAAGASAPARGEAPGSTPRTRSRWQSLVPGMLK
jgi:hypothetical protein